MDFDYAPFTIMMIASKPVYIYAFDKDSNLMFSQASTTNYQNWDAKGIEYIIFENINDSPVDVKLNYFESYG